MRGHGSNQPSVGFRVCDEPDFEELKGVLAAADRTIMNTGVVAREKLFAPDARASPQTIAEVVNGRIEGFATICGRVLRLIAVRPESQRSGIGSRLLGEAERRIFANSDRVIVGAGPGNYLVPGVDATDGGTLAFFAAHGYSAEREQAIDLRAPLPPATAPIPEEYEIRRPAGAERGCVEKFVREDFAFSWGWEIGRAFDRDGEPSCLVAERKGEIAGFAGWEINNRGLGTFGPQGVSRHHRSKGLGGALLLATLHEMSREGYDEVHIPWVSSVEYYRRYTGARVVARYELMEKRKGVS